MDEARTGHCALRGRPRRLTFHHLIPRKVHSNKWFKKNFTRRQMAEGIDVCRDCHAAIHKLIPDAKQLGRRYNTRARLLDHDHLANFVRWIRGRKTSGRVRTRRVREG